MTTDPMRVQRPAPIEVHGGDELRRSVSEYGHVVSRYAAGHLDGRSFESAFFELCGNDRFRRPDLVERIIENFFFAVEDCVADPSLRTEPEDLNDEQLRERARQYLADMEIALAHYP